MISLSEMEARVRDLNGNEIYLDIPLQRDTYDKLIAERIGESIESAKEALNKAGLSLHDLEHIVFIGAPTNYKPLSDKMAFELCIPGNTDINSITDVAEGMNIFTESIDWSSQSWSSQKIPADRFHLVLRWRCLSTILPTYRMLRQRLLFN